MIFTLNDISPKVRTQIQTFSRLKPVPQFLAWENAASQLLKKGNALEAAVLLELATKNYGKSVGRAAFERVFNIPVDKLGRGISQCCGFANHPAIFTLRDHLAPCQIGQFIALRACSNLVLANPVSKKLFMINAFSEKPQSMPMIFADDDLSNPIQFIAVGALLLYANGTDTLYCVDLSNPEVSGGDPVKFNVASLKFNTKIKNLCGPLANGTFFVTHESEIPVLSDVCHLCHLDFNKIFMHFYEHPGETFDIREIDAIDKDIVLTNIEQSFDGDCIAANDVFMTCRGGMQPNEVRFIAADGSWTTRLVHESPVIRILRSENGPVSLDKSGLALLWDGMTPVDHFQFEIDKLPQVFKDNLDDSDFTIDWTHKRLYLTVTIPPQSSLRAALMASHSCCLESGAVREDAFVKKIYHFPIASVAMLADASFHFWNNALDCVDIPWQLPQVCAEQKDWSQILSDNSPDVEHDPRIRQYINS